MRFYKIVLVTVFLIFNISKNSFADNFDTKELFAPVISEIQHDVDVPFYLPSLLPELISQHGIYVADGKLKKGQYIVSFYYGKEPIMLAYAGAVTGSTLTFDDLPNTQTVYLNNNVKALFRPISCGGSCSPANLWWQLKGHQYSVQVKFPSSTNEQLQIQALSIIANSMVAINKSER
mgnify:CR=1 FL=1